MSPEAASIEGGEPRPLHAPLGKTLLAMVPVCNSPFSLGASIANNDEPPTLGSHSEHVSTSLSDRTVLNLLGYGTAPGSSTLLQGARNVRVDSINATTVGGNFNQTIVNVNGPDPAKR